MVLTKPISLSRLGRMAWAAVQQVRAATGPQPGRQPHPDFAPTVPSDRSVPMPVAALTRLLDQHPSMRSRMKHLALI